MKETRQNNSARRISLSTKIFWTQIVQGILGLLIAVTGLLRENWLLDTVHLILMLTVIGVMIVMSRVRSDDFDEMALANQQQAKAKTLDILIYIFLGISMTALVPPLPELLPGLLAKQELFNLVMASVWLVIGLQSLISGLIFRKLEAG